MKILVGGLLVSTSLIAASLLLTVQARPSTNALPQQKSSRESVYWEISKAPEKARGKRNPLEKDPDAVAAGQILFEQRCAECHGVNGEGSKRGPSLSAAEIQEAEPGAIFWILTNGVVRKGMPVWSKLPEPQRWQIVSYIKSLGGPGAKTEASPPSGPKPRSPKESSLPGFGPRR